MASLSGSRRRRQTGRAGVADRYPSRTGSPTTVNRLDRSWSARHVEFAASAPASAISSSVDSPSRSWSREESFRRAEERERQERARSAEGFRLAEERERHDRMRSAEQFRIAQEREQSARETW